MSPRRSSVGFDRLNIVGRDRTSPRSPPNDPAKRRAAVVFVTLITAAVGLVVISLFAWSSQSRTLALELEIVGGPDVDGPAILQMQHHAQRCIPFVTCDPSLFGGSWSMRQTDSSRAARLEGGRLRVDDLVMERATLGHDALSYLTIRLPSRDTVGIGPTTQRPEPYAGSWHSGIGNAEEYAYRDGDIAVWDRHGLFLPSTLEFVPAGVDGLRIRIDVSPLPVTSFGIGRPEDGFEGEYRHPESGCVYSHPYLFCPAGTSIDVPIHTGMSAPGLSQCYRIGSALPSGSRTEVFVVDEATFDGILPWRRSFLPRMPVSADDRAALRAAHDEGDAVRARVQGDRLRVETRAPARRWVIVVASRPEDDEVSADALFVDSESPIPEY